jgi:outer membrane lipoprotein-sorting protein
VLACVLNGIKEFAFMHRMILLLCVIVLSFPLATRAQSVDEVIANNVKAHGGLEKLKSVRTIRTTARLSAGSFRLTFVVENKRADKVREEAIIQGMAQVRAYDGKSAWQISPFSGRKDPELISQDDAKDLAIDADIDGLLVDYKEKGHKAELVGHDPVEGTDCYKVKLTMKNGDVRYYFLDADSFLEIKIETQSNIRGTVQYNETYLGDYEAVDGIYFPFAIEQGEKGSDSRQKLTVDKVELNVPLDDSRFTMPAAKPEAKSASAAK